MSALFPKVPSGIPGLDAMIGGGLPKNSLITLSGSTGSGRTTFAAQFLVEGWRQNHEPGLYLSFDEPKFSIFANMSNYAWDLPELEREKHVVFIEYPHHELANFMEQENSMLELIDTLGVERVVFDSITPIAMQFDGDERRRELLKLVNVIRRWGVTAMISAEEMVPPDPNLPRTNVGIEGLTDGFIHLGLSRDGPRRTRTLEVVKMRGSIHEHEIRPFVIGSTGIQLVGSGQPGAPAMGNGRTREVLERMRRLSVEDETEPEASAGKAGLAFAPNPASPKPTAGRMGQKPPAPLKPKSGTAPKKRRPPSEPGG